MTAFLLKTDVEEIVSHLPIGALEQFAGKHVLITGGRGFLGRYFTAVFDHLNRTHLLSKPVRVTCLDNFISAGPAGRDVSEFADGGNVLFAKHDVIKPMTREHAMTANAVSVFDRIESGVDFILAAAGIASPAHYRKHPLATLEVSIVGLKNTLELAKTSPGCRVSFFSSSEIYGDPDSANVPTKETYRGNVSCLGPRSAYDEGKRLGETMVKIYAEQHDVHGTIIRPFNCLPGDQKVIYEQDGRLFFESFEECYRRTGGSPVGVSVPAFDKDGGVAMRKVTNVLRRHTTEKVVTVRTRWGREVTCTEDHNLFVFADGEIKGRPVVSLKSGDKVVVPRRLNMPEVDLAPFFISDKIPTEGLSVRSEAARDVVAARPEILRCAAHANGIENRLFSSYCRKWETKDRLSWDVFQAAAVPRSHSEEICYSSSDRFVKNRVENIDEFLWLLGYTLADGHVLSDEGNYALMYSDKNAEHMDRVVAAAKTLFGLTTLTQYDKNGKPYLSMRSRVLTELFQHFGVDRARNEKDLPAWLIQLPPARIAKFLHGFWCGDGNHHSKTTGEFIIFCNSNLNVIHGLNALLLRLGHVGGMFSFKSRAGKDQPYYDAYRIEVRGVKGVSVDRLHEAPGLNADRYQDIAFAEVTSVETKPFDGFVYDFTVPGAENFVGGGMGIFCHNCYGPGMQATDYRVLPNFAAKIALGEQLEVYGDGKQTRTYCYITDAIGGFLRVLLHGKPGEPYNIGNPSPEISVNDLATKVYGVLGSMSIPYGGVKLMDHPASYPADEPNRRCPDISKAARELGYAPRVSLDDGLRRFFGWAMGTYPRTNSTEEKSVASAQL